MEKRKWLRGVRNQPNAGADASSNGDGPARVSSIESGVDLDSTANMTEIMTVQEVARALRCSKAHVYNVIAGKVKGISPLRVISLGRRKLVRRATFVTWQSENEKVFPGVILRLSPQVDAADA